jgi:hypothetical protein
MSPFVLDTSSEGNAWAIAGASRIARKSIGVRKTADAQPDVRMQDAQCFDIWCRIRHVVAGI